LLSPTEAEYKALSDACKEIVWVWNITQEIFPSLSHQPTSVFVDNRGAINLALSQMSQNSFRTKHMDLRLHFVRELVIDKTVQLRYVSTQQNIADFLTKPVGRSVISRAISRFTGGASSIVALCSKAPSMPGCQSSPERGATDAQVFMNLIGKYMYLN
jgi:hypothetical protein